MSDYPYILNGSRVRDIREGCEPVTKLENTRRGIAARRMAA